MEKKIEMDSYACIPIVTTGQYARVGQRLMLPLTRQGTPGLVDGDHLGEFYRLLDKNLAAAHELPGGLVRS